MLATHKDKPHIKVLLAEDNDIGQYVVSQYLKHNGYDVDVAQNGLVAWRMLAKQDYDLLLTDIQMPNMCGLELIKKVRAQVDQKISIVVLSAYATEELRQQCLQAGADSFFTKPLRLDKLKQVLSLVSAY